MDKKAEVFFMKKKVNGVWKYTVVYSEAEVSRHKARNWVKVTPEEYKGALNSQKG